MDDKQITVYYNSESSVGKQARAFIQAFDKEVLEIDVLKSKVTGTQWIEITDKLGISVKNLINTKHSKFLKEYGEGPMNFSEEDWIKILQKNPELLYGTVTIMGQNIYHYINPSDFIKHMSKG